MLGDTPLRRVGKAPKRLLVYRSEEQASVAGLRGLDILGFGRQFVAFAIHPDTKKPYEWGDNTPLDTPLANLPLVTAEMVEEFVLATGLSAPETSEGGTLAAPVYNIRTGLVEDNRESWLFRCVLQAAKDNPEGSPEAWADDAWDHFRTTTYLERKSDHELSEKGALKKAKYVHRSVETNKIALPDKNVLPNSDPPVVAHAFRPELGDGGFWRGDFYRWSGAGWQVMDGDEVTSRFYRWIDGKRFAKNPAKITRNFVSDALAALKGLNRLGSDDMPFWIDRRDDDPDPVNLLPFNNGLLNVETGELLPHDRRLFTLHRVDCDYEPDALCPTYDHFLEQVLPNDAASRETLGEFFGYCLTTDTRQQKALMMIGQKRSGRGTLMRLLRTVVGSDACASPTLAQFGRQGLIGKSVAMLTDVRGQDRSNPHSVVEAVLTITGEDPQQIQRKYKDDWFGRLPVRIILVSNIVPKLTDAAGVVASRFIALDFPVSFAGREDHDLEQKLMAELPGIVNLWLAGLARLRQRGRFVQPETGEPLLELLRRDADPVLTFIEEECETGAEFQIEKKAFNDALSAWLAEGNYHSLNAETIAKRLYAQGIKPNRVRGGEGRLQVYAGIRLRMGSDSADHIEMIDRIEGRNSRR